MCLARRLYLKQLPVSLLVLLLMSWSTNSHWTEHFQNMLSLYYGNKMIDQPFFCKSENNKLYIWNKLAYIVGIYWIAYYYVLQKAMLACWSASGYGSINLKPDKYFSWERSYSVKILICDSENLTLLLCVATLIQNNKYVQNPHTTPSPANKLLSVVIDLTTRKTRSQITFVNIFVLNLRTALLAEIFNTWFYRSIM